MGPREGRDKACPYRWGRRSGEEWVCDQRQRREIETRRQGRIAGACIAGVLPAQERAEGPIAQNNRERVERSEKRELPFPLPQNEWRNGCALVAAALGEGELAPTLGWTLEHAAIEWSSQSRLS